ncbi:MAG: T9SS type A sorting domain-containing protein, partial [Saprospiraceae bacterium]|nr:T9SS type A sorting domain-containing protein [Saprospiraceae bacterium]
LSPIDESTGIPLTTTFNWQEVQGAETYQIQISEDNAFATIVVDESDLMNNTMDYTFSEFDMPYYWRVRAINSTGESPWSEVWSFTTEMPLGLVDLGLTYNLKTYPNPANNSLFIEFNSPISKKANLRFFDSSGKLIFRNEVDIKPGQNLLEADLSHLPNGNYQFTIKIEDIDLSGKFIKIE